MGSKKRRHREKLRQRAGARSESSDATPSGQSPASIERKVRFRGVHVGPEAQDVAIMGSSFEGVDQLARVEGSRVMIWGSQATSPFVEGRPVPKDKPDSPMLDIAATATDGVYARNISIGGSGQVARDAGTRSEVVDNIAVSDAAVRELGATLLQEIVRLRQAGVAVPDEAERLATELASSSDRARFKTTALKLLPLLAHVAQLAQLALQVQQIAARP